MNKEEKQYRKNAKEAIEGISKAVDEALGPMTKGKYNRECGLSKQEWELDNLADEVIASDSSLERIGILRKYLDNLLRETAIKFHLECIGEPEAIKDPEIKKHYDALFEDFLTSPTGDKK